MVDDGDELVFMFLFDDDVFGDDGEVDDEFVELIGLCVVVIDIVLVVIVYFE